MEKHVDVSFPGNKKVDASIDGWTVHTDQPADSGGDNTAPSPFQLFFAAIGSCAGVYALNFCRSREIPTDGMAVRVSCRFDEVEKRYTAITIRLTLPESFPEKYVPAIIRAIDLCAVKKHIVHAPSFEITVA